MKTAKRNELTEKAKPKVSINVDEFGYFYRYTNLNEHEIKYLLAKKYQIVDKKSIVSGKVEKFLLKPRFNESINHMFAVFDIADFLESKNIIANKYITKKPDLTFEIDKNKFAIEVETGTVYEKARVHLMEKIKSLNENYDYWFFIVTNRNFIKKYRKLGKVVDTRYLANQMNRLVENG